MSRPNFVVIMTDQQRADHLGCYGNPTMRTPAIDGLARRGWVFDECFVAAPMCMSNRASFMTSRMPSLHGVRHNGIPLSMRLPTFVEVLRADGFATALIGKSHLQNMEDELPRLRRESRPGRRELEGFEEARGENLHGVAYRQELPSSWQDSAHRVSTPFYGFDHVELCDEHGDLVFGDYSRWLAARDPRAFAARGPKGALPCDSIVAPQAWRTSVPEELYPSRFIGDRAIAYLENHARQRPGAPFFLMCSFPDPHHPFTPPGRYWDMFDPAALKLPRSFAHPRALMPAPLAWLHDERQAGKAPLGSHRAFAVEEAEARQAIALTYGMIALVDDMVASILKALATLGFADNTVVVFTSDHGDFMGDHGLLLKGPLHYRSLIRVPLVWRDPEIGRPGRSRALASTIDIPETILDRAGLAGPQGAQGISLMSIMRGERETVRDALLIEDETQRAFLGFSRPIRVRTMVTSDSRLSLYGEGEAGEMYETGQDPDEMTNLWDAPSHRSVRAQRVERLARLMLDMGDRSPLPTGLA